MAERRDLQGIAVGVPYDRDASERLIVRILKDWNAARGAVDNELIDVFDGKTELQRAGAYGEHIALSMQAQNRAVAELEAHWPLRQILAYPQAENVAVEIARAREVGTDEHDD
ncbi:MAG: hypothetical protein WBE79_14245 [Candidatus Cybelea sp.]